VKLGSFKQLAHIDAQRRGGGFEGILTVREGFDSGDQVEEAPARRRSGECAPESVEPRRGPKVCRGGKVGSEKAHTIAACLNGLAFERAGAPDTLPEDVFPEFLTAVLGCAIAAQATI
jgi:hypothetical protein